MEKVNVTLQISCLVVCPECDFIFDLFEMDSLIDDGYIYEELLPEDECWGKDHWGEIVQCPECKEKIAIDMVEY